MVVVGIKVDAILGGQHYLAQVDVKHYTLVFVSQKLPPSYIVHASVSLQCVTK